MSDARLGVAFLGLHPERRGELVRRHGGPSGLMRAVRRGQIEGIAPDAAGSPARREAALRDAGARVVYLGAPEYPELLAVIADPPDVLFVRGSLPPAPMVAVVGTRRSTAYGRSLARAFGRAVAEAGWALCSGLARGIDGEAHRGALEAGGATVGVLGCGSDVVYPREHLRLIAEVEGAGAVVTEYPPGTPPHGWRFPPRNRIISGLSRAVVVVEAAATGGALVTAARAAEQGREVFAVPGDVDRESSLGCNLLIRDGAIPVLGAADLIEALALVIGPVARRTSADPVIPVTGLAMEELADRLGLSGPSLLAWLGRAELGGAVRIEGSRVFPGRV
ncbi:MAG: DNA-protecting protein DprA [Acidimicrobiia bacterium]|nr:DNA-protecting protein DprA [Acidimicrobiia bacterium]